MLGRGREQKSVVFLLKSLRETSILRAAAARSKEAGTAGSAKTIAFLLKSLRESSILRAGAAGAGRPPLPLQAI